ncbi:RNA-binding protein [Candidatus Woesearchaeota archaeon]|nr:RNA-binding protein [Candidatus Woesearchaeota archaeon]
MEQKTCSSCKIDVVNDPGRARFKCPSCGDYDIVRCIQCRKNAVKYTCPGCNFLGPN